MEIYNVEIFNIQDIKNPVKLDEITILAESKSEAIDNAHTAAEKMYPKHKRMVSLRKSG
jgi:hypothetical protein